MPNFKLSRRAMLRGVLGGVAASVALPPLEAMFNAHGTTLAAGAPIPKRFGVFFWGNGVKPDRFWPKTTGTNFALQPEMQPLAPVKDYVSVVSGMEARYSGKSIAHHTGAKTMLTGSIDTNIAKYGKPTTASMDQQVAAALKGQALYPSLVVGVTRMNYEGSTNNGKSAYDFAGNTIRAEQSPQGLFDRLFKAGSLPKSGPDPQKASRLAVVDIVLAQSKALKQRLGAADRRIVDGWLDGVHNLQKKVAAADAAQCKAPPSPGIGMAQDKAREPLQKISEAMADLVAAALICDLTRVFSFEFTGYQTSTIFSEIGVNEQLHNLTHDEPGDQPKVHRTVVHTMSQLSYLLQRLKATPEGAGNLLDSCAIVATSEVADGRTHSLRNIPILIAGRAGRLKGGVHYSGRSGSGYDNASRATLTAMQAVAPSITSFGVGAARTTSPIGAL